MDCFGGLRSEGEWDLCSSILSLEELDFAPIIPDANWFCSNLDYSFTSKEEFRNCIGAVDYDHNDPHITSMSGGAIEEEKIESIFSACSEIFLQEITGFCGEDHHRFVNMDYVQTQRGDNNAIIASNNNPLLHHKRKSIDLLPHDDDHIPNKKTPTSINVEKTRKSTVQANIGKTKQKLSCRRRRKCEEEEENGSAGSSEIMNSCSTGNSSEDDNNAKPKTRATRGSATDPQSLYARKRRERINERLKLLQKLVPNGTKVDISTMLEEAVHYVKFLQLQIKLLSSDELWMYAPIAYNGMDIDLQQKFSSIL